jgi:hypothetical protein
MSLNASKLGFAALLAVFLSAGVASAVDLCYTHELSTDIWRAHSCSVTPTPVVVNAVVCHSYDSVNDIYRAVSCDAPAPSVVVNACHSYDKVFDVYHAVPC